MAHIWKMSAFTLVFATIRFLCLVSLSSWLRNCLLFCALWSHLWFLLATYYASWIAWYCFLCLQRLVSLRMSSPCGFGRISEPEAFLVSHYLWKVQNWSHSGLLRLTDRERASSPWFCFSLWNWFSSSFELVAHSCTQTHHMPVFSSSEAATEPTFQAHSSAAESALMAYRANWCQTETWCQAASSSCRSAFRHFSCLQRNCFVTPAMSIFGPFSSVFTSWVISSFQPWNRGFPETNQNAHLSRLGRMTPSLNLWYQGSTAVKKCPWVTHF